LTEVTGTLLNINGDKYAIMPECGVRLKPKTKEALQHLAGKDYSMDDVISILLDNFIEPEESDKQQSSLFDYDEPDNEILCPECNEPLNKYGSCIACGYPEE
jgi:hypothetical protein